MNKLKFLGFVAAATFTANAQDVEQAKKAIDAEQYEKAISVLEKTISAKPSGEAYFYLGNVYLKQNSPDLAKSAYQKGLEAGEKARWNNIGLGQLDLDNGNKSAAQAKFDLVIKELKKKDVEEYVHIARAYMNADKPDFGKAIELLLKAKSINGANAEVLLALGDAYFGNRNNSEAFVAYRDALAVDSNLLKAKLQSGVLLKEAANFEEAINRFNEVKAIAPNYGPLYRELAETYNKWSVFKPSKDAEYKKLALENYVKYMSLTDTSLASRLRYADFLLKNKDYATLEAEVKKMKEKDGVNPRVMRYLGYSAYENGNYDEALNALNTYISKPGNKIIGRDYLYLGMTKIKKATNAEGKTDETQMKAALADIKKAIEVEPLLSSEFSDWGQKYFAQKDYGNAAEFFAMALSNSSSKTYLTDSAYYAICVYTDNSRKEAEQRNNPNIEKAVQYMNELIVKNPSYQDAYLYGARLNELLGKKEEMTKNYEGYVNTVIGKGDAEVKKQQSKVIEAYLNSAEYYANSDKTKAIEYLDKILVIDPANKYAEQAKNQIK